MATPPDAVAQEHWLLLIHQTPPKPDYLRVKVGRRLRRIGAVPIKNSVYVLPRRADTNEDFQWVAREIREAGGEAIVADAALVDGLSDTEVRALFASARDEDYAELLAAGRAIARALGATKPPSDARRRQIVKEVAKLTRRIDPIVAIDFFGAPRRAEVQTLLAELQRKLAPPVIDASSRERTSPRGCTWVTRRGVHVDRIASAWLIRRFIDPAARFRFVDPQSYAPRAGEYRFDMFDAEFTHVGGACTFEVLAARFVPDDAGLRRIGEIVHDIDCKDAKFQREEAAGMRRIITGITVAHAADEARLERGAALMDDLYAAFAAGTDAS